MDAGRHRVMHCNTGIGRIIFAFNFSLLLCFFLSLDSMIILWKLNASPDQNTNDILMETDEIQNKESWTFHKALR